MSAADAESDEEVNYPEDPRMGSEGSRALPMQQQLDAHADIRLSATLHETVEEMDINGENAADRSYSIDSAMTEDAWVPDFASGYDYVFMLPATVRINSV